MAKINILTSDIYNRISAGEVVERPKSVVKELVENSIDAGANSINIEIEDGGITSIKITDNGCGIEQSYVATAFMPHATSKVSTYEDLNNMSTLGFRGEALAAISSVSTVELSTKSCDENTGTYLEIRGGNHIKHESIDRNIGTSIVIRNLFFNTPARQKFLKRPKSEEADITSVVIGLILSNPHISFKYFVDNTLIYSSDGKGLESAIYSVYPTSVTKGLIKFVHEAHGLVVFGYISIPEVTKSNRNLQTAIVNGRLIENITISTAVARAYGNKLMKRNFPIFILDIVVPFDTLDVNVTPSKTDVRFYDNKAVFSAIYRGVEIALAKNEKVFEISDNSFLSDNVLSIDTSLDTDNKSINSNENTNVSLKDVNYSEITPKVELSICDNSNTSNISPKCENIAASKIEDIIESKDDSNVIPSNASINMSDVINKIVNTKASNIFTANSIDDTMLKVHDNNIHSCKINENDVVQSSLFDDIEISLNTEKYNILGQIFNTYLLIEKGVCLYLIDQHAAHERIIYDNLISKINNRSIGSQQVLAPQIVYLSVQDLDYVMSISLQLEKIGLFFESHGNDSLRITGVPTVLPNFNADKFFKNIIIDKYALNDIELVHLLDDNIAMSACKAAIKAGQILNEVQINGLIKQIEENKPCQCPHGRPTIIKITRKDIDKLFRRII